MTNISDEIALIVCSRNRLEHLNSLFTMLSGSDLLPASIVIVDSSDTMPFKVPSNFNRDVNVRVLHTPAGLPFQKNKGISEVLSLENRPKIVSFLDDDVRVDANYFSEVLRLFEKNPEFAAIGGYDVAQGPYPSSRLRKLLGLSPRDGSGMLLRNGIAIPPVPKKELEIVDWLPGFTTNFRVDVIENFKFDGSVRIYGEEVAFQLQISEAGPIGSSVCLPVVHLQAQESKDQVREIQGYYDGFRWAMAVKYPKRFSKGQVLFAVFSMMVGEMSRWIVRRDDKGREGLLGHLDFLKRLIVGEDVQQRVNHLFWKQQ